LIASSQSVIEYTKLTSTINLNSFKLEERAFLTEAMKIASAVQTDNFQKFFKLFKSTNYMFACLMLTYFEQMRREALA